MTSTTVSGRTDGRTHDHDHDDHKRTPAQWFCLLVGPALILAGILGFLADASFDTGVTTDPEGGNADGALQGDGFLGFEVNGWHNLVHLASGLFLLSMYKKRKTAKTAVLAFAAIYAIVTLIGLIDGNDVLGILPVNPADNILHIGLTLGALAAGLLSKAHYDRHRAEKVRTVRTTERARAHEGTAPVTTGRTTGRTVETETAGRGTTESAGHGRTLRPEDHDETRGRR